MSHRHFHHTDSGPADYSTSDLLVACTSLCNRAQRLIVTNIKSYAASCHRHLTLSGKPAGVWSDTPVAASGHESGTKSVEIAHQTELKLWQDLKKFKETGDKIVMQYVCGFYTGLVHMVCWGWSGSGEQFLVQPLNLLSGLKINSQALFRPDDESADIRLFRSLVYNLLIRLGDVNRYLKNQTACRSYYSQARQLHPGRGHAFNQLALISSSDPMTQVYFYVRACCAMHEPVSIAAHNLRSSGTRLSDSNELAAALLSEDNNRNTGSGFPVHLVTDWVQVLVIAIYAERTALVTKPLLDQALSCLRRKVGCNPFSSIRFEARVVEQNSVNLLSAVDVLVDYATTSSEGRMQSLPCLSDCETELKKLQIEVISILSQSDDFAIGSLSTASRQDYQLLGFAPLRHAHEKLTFEQQPVSPVTAASPAVAAGLGPDPVPLQNNEFISLIKRLRVKIDTVLHVIADKTPLTGNKNPVSRPVVSPVASLSSPTHGKAPARSRNVALKSILSAN